MVFIFLNKKNVRPWLHDDEYFGAMNLTPEPGVSDQIYRFDLNYSFTQS